MLQDLHMPHSYYSKQLPCEWRLVALDTTEISGHSCYPKVSKSVMRACLACLCLPCIAIQLDQRMQGLLFRLTMPTVTCHACTTTHDPVQLLFNMQLERNALHCVLSETSA